MSYRVYVGAAYMGWAWQQEVRGGRNRTAGLGLWETGLEEGGNDESVLGDREMSPRRQDKST